MAIIKIELDTTDLSVVNAVVDAIDAVLGLIPESSVVLSHV